MFEKLLQKILKDVVGEFIDGIDTKKLNIGIWSGTVQILNVSLKPGLLAMLGLPYTITFSNISRLFITIPWKNLFTAPLVIEIDSVLILAENIGYQLTKQEQSKIVLLKIKQFIQKLARQLAQNKKIEQKTAGYLDNVYLKMLDNLYLTVRNIHFRFEVPRPLKYQPEATPFQFGITLQLIQLFAVDEKGNRVFIDRSKLSPDKNIIFKKLKLENFGFYWNFDEKQIFFLSPQAEGGKKQDLFYKQMLDLRQINAGKGLGKEKINYVVLINAQGVVKEDSSSGKNANKLTKYEVSFNIKQLKMILNQKIIKQMVWLMKQISFIRTSMKNFITPQFTGQWEGPKNQSILGLLRKYCINQFWESQNANKTNSGLTLAQQRILMEYLYENRLNLSLIQLKMREIIVGDIGNKSLVNKNSMVNNWQSIQALMTQQKDIQGKLQIKFSFNLQQINLYYVDDIKMPIAQLLLKGFIITADRNQQNDLVLIIEMAKFQGFGYDQNPIIRMEHQIQVKEKGPKINKIPKFFYMIYKSKCQAKMQQIQIDMGGIGFIYDFKTFRQLYRLPEGLISNQTAPDPTSPASKSPQNRAQNMLITSQNSDNKKFFENLKYKNAEKDQQFQITITVDNISVYIQQYAKKTWRISLSECQLTNSESFIPENILISAMSLSVSDFYVLEPFGLKIVLNLRNTIPEISVFVEPVILKIGSEQIKNLIKIPSCLQTYKKNDAISLSSRYGQIFLLHDQEVWKKYDGVIIDGLLYLYQKSQQYSKYQLRINEAVKKSNNKRETIQITINEEGKNEQKLILIVKNPAQFNEWYNYLCELAQIYRKTLGKNEGKKKQKKSQTKPQVRGKKKQNLNLSIVVTEMSLYMVIPNYKNEIEKLLGLVLRTTTIQFNQQCKQTELRKKPFSKTKTAEQDEDIFKSFKQIKLKDKFTSVSQQESPSTTKLVSNQNAAEQYKLQQKVKISIKNIEFWYKTSRRVVCSNKVLQPQQQQQLDKSIQIEIVTDSSSTMILVQICNKLIVDYQPYEIIQIISYLQNQILNLFVCMPAGTKISSHKIIENDEFQVKAKEVRKNNKSIGLRVQIKNSCEVNCFNMPTYNKYRNIKEQKQVKVIGKILTLTAQNITIIYQSSGIKIQGTGLQANWLVNGNNKEEVRHILLSSLVLKNKLSLQIVNSKLNVSVSGLYLPNYKHYLIMRGIDYLLTYFKSLFLYTSTFNEYFDIFCDGDKNVHTKFYRLKQDVENKMTQSQILNLIKSLLEIQVSIYEAFIGVQEIGLLSIVFVGVRNQYIQTYNHSIRDKILSDQYLIQLKDIKVKLSQQKWQKGQQKQQLAQNVGRKEEELVKKASQAQSRVNETELGQKIGLRSKIQQQRFYTVFNRFTNAFNQQEWIDKVKLKTFQLVDEDCPLDLSISVVLFGKYALYKTLFPKFELSKNNSSISIRLKMSELHINLLSNQIKLGQRLVRSVISNISYSDGNSYYYSYDEQVIKQLYRQSIQKNNKYVINFDKDGIPIVTIPMQQVLKQQQYIQSPIQFSLELKKVIATAILIDDLILKKQNSQQGYKSGGRLTQKSNIQPKSSVKGIQFYMETLSINYIQSPMSQISIQFNLLQLSHLQNGERIKVVEFTSASQRISRQTMFIDGSYQRKQQGSTRQKIRKQERGVQTPENKKNIRKNNYSQGEIGQNIQPLDVQMKDIRMGVEKDDSEALSLKIGVKRKLKNEGKMVQEGGRSEPDQVKNIDLLFHNIVVTYDINSIKSGIRLKQVYEESKTKQMQPTRQWSKKQLPNSQKTFINCRFFNFLFYLPSKLLSQENKLPNNHHEDKTQLDYIFCLLLKFNLQMEFPQLMPFNLQCDHLEIYTEENNQQIIDQSTPVKNYTHFFKEQASGLAPKSRKKTLIQPTKLLLKRKIVEAMGPAVKKQKTTPEPNLMSSRIKSLLNLSSAPNSSQEKDNINEQTQFVTCRHILQQIEIDKCFVKISIEDVQQLAYLFSIVTNQLSSSKIQQQPLKQSGLKLQSLQGQPKATKKVSILQKMEEREKNIQISRSLENIFRTKELDQQTLSSKSTEQTLKIVNRIKFKPLQIIVISSNTSANIPLLYSKLQITDYETQSFNLQLAANYFNLRINAWEPFLQEFIFVIKLSPHFSISKLQQKKQEVKADRKSKENPRFQNEKPNEFLHLNISTNFLEVLIPALQNKNGDKLSIKRNSQTKSSGDDVNCWMLVNQLGYDITCESKNFRGNKMVTTLSIPNNKSKKLTFLNDLFNMEGFQQVLKNEDQYEISQIINLGENQKKKKFAISIIINNQIKIKQIDIGQTGVKKLCFNYDGHPYWIYSHTFTDISKNVKYVKFCSEVVVKNLTDVDIWIKLPYMKVIQSDPKKEDQILQKKKTQQIEQKLRKLSYNVDLVKDKTNALYQFLSVQKNIERRIKSDHDKFSQNSADQRLQTSFQKPHTNRPNFVRIPAKKDLSLAFDIDEDFKRLSEHDFSELLFKQPPEDNNQIKETKQQSDDEKQKALKMWQFQITKQRKKMRTIFRIQAAGKIINKLPQTINIALKSQDHILYSFTMVQDQYQFVYTPFNMLEISLHSDGFQWTNFTPFNVFESIGLLDFNKNKLNVKISMFYDEDGINNVIFYPIAVLYNNTDYDIKIRDPESKNYSFNKVMPKKSVSLSNNRILIIKPEIPIQTGFSSKKTNFTKIYMNQQQITCKFEIDSANTSLNDRQLQHIPPTATEALVINQISLKTSSGIETALQNNQIISTKFVTVSHKFYFNNQTEYIILIRKFTGSENSSRSKFTNFSVRQYQPYSSQSFFLFQQDAIKNNPNLTYYELTIKNSPYEWSGALSITKTGNNHFILRNRAHFNEVVFLNLVVIKYHRIEKFKIELKMVEKQQVPFRIKNCLSDVLIKLPEYGNIVLKQGQQVDYSWDQPILKSNSIPILLSLSQQGSFDRINYTRYEIKAQNNQNDVIKIRKYPQMGEVNVVQNSFTKIFQIRQYKKIEGKVVKLLAEILLPIRIAIINNSFTPVYHLCDISTNAAFKISKISDAMIMNANLNSIQLDNQTRYRVYFPVVLSTSLSINANISKNIEIELITQPIILNVEQDFGRDFYTTAMLISSIGNDKKEQQSLSRIQNETESNKILISKLKLPEVVIKLQVKTKKLSIQTSIHLQRPAVTKFPWRSFPYPIKNIAINLLSHLSISPWALISSFQRGVVSLLTEQESTNGIEGFFGQIIAALSNSVGGFAGILVGHDIERVDNFFDGIEQGTNLLIHEIRQIKDSFQPQQCTIPSILKGVGYGIISIVLKPMKGVLQFTLKVSEGIKKTALYRFDQSENKYRERDLIVFYGQEQKFRTYDGIQSQLMVMLLKICGEPLKYFHLVKFYVIDNKLTNTKQVLSIGTQQLIFFNAKAQKLIWQINLHEVTQITIVRYSSIKFSPFEYELDAFHQDDAEQIFNTLIKMQRKLFIRT